MHGLRETAPPGPYFPFHRDETYPRTLCVNFKRLEYRTLQKYCKLHAINVRPDCTQSELAVAAARHFQEAPSVDEEGVMVSFLKQVIVPDKPFRPTIDLALARMGSLSVDNGELGGGGRGVMPNAVMHDLNSNSNNIDMDDHGHMHGGDDGMIEEGEGEMMAAGGGGGPQRERDHSGGRGVHGNHGYGGRHGHPSSVVGAGGGMGYDEKPRGDWSRVPIRDGPSAGRGYGHEYEYGGPRHQVSSSWDHLQDGPGGEMMSKLGKRSGNGSSSARSRNGRGSSGSAPGHGSVPVMTSSSDRGMSMPGVGEDGKGRRQKNNDRGVGSGVDASSSVNIKPPPGKKSRKGSVGWRAKNGEQVAVRDDRGEEPGAWILARVLKYVPETHQYELKDDDDKEGIGMLTAPRSLVIRLEDNTKGVQRGERVLAVFPDTTSFYLGTVHRVVKPIPGLERRIEVKFNDDADSNGRTPARPLPARYVIPLPDGFEEDDSKPAEMDDDDEQPAHGGGGGGRGAGEEDADEPMGGEEDGGGSTSIPYVEMIRTALLKLPGRQGNLPTVCAYIEEHFHERLNWTSESTLRRTPAWKASVRRTLAHHPSFCHAGTPERNVYTLAE